MPFLLLTVLVIALIITIAGLVLTSKAQLGNGRALSFTGLSRYLTLGPTRTRSGYRTVEPMRTRDEYRTVEPARTYGGYRTVEPMRTRDGYRTVEPVRTRSGYRTVEPMRTRDGYRTIEPKRARRVVVDAKRDGVIRIPTLLGYARGRDHVGPVGARFIAPEAVYQSLASPPLVGKETWGASARGRALPNYPRGRTLLDYINGRRTDGSTSWTVTAIGLVSIFVLGLYILTGLLPSHSLIGFIPFYGNLAPSSSNQNLSTELHGASLALARLSQLDPGQYDSRDQYNTWAYSACSAAALTEVINAYGHHYRVADVLKIEAGLGEISPALGLTEVVGIARTAQQFGFKTTWGYNLSLDQAIAVANQGKPIIIDFPPDKYAGGHILVLTGGNKDSVYLADSSLYNRRALSRTQFLQWWGGFTAILTPQ